jgi:phage terminase small subunit
MSEQLRAKHKAFADYYIESDEAVLSYQKVYPKCSLHSAQTKSGVLLKNVEIAKYIQEYKDKVKNARENNLIETIKAKDNSNILTREKIVEMTSNVVKLTYNNFVATKDGDDAEVYIKAVSALNKLEGHDAAKNIVQKNTHEMIGLAAEFVDRS